MERLSLVKFHKYPRRILLTRRTLARIPGATTRYIHRSAGFATLISELGLEGIGNYVSMMNGQVTALRRMSGNESIDAGIVMSLVETVNTTADMNMTSLNHIRNSLVRFMHTDAEPIIRPRLHGRKAARRHGRHPEESPEPGSPQQPVSWHIPGEAAAGCDAHHR